MAGGAAQEQEAQARTETEWQIVMTQQHKPTLLEQARLTDTEIDELDRLEGSAHPNWSFDDELKGIANAATRKAFEVLEAWLRAEAERLQEKRLSYSGLLAVIATLRAQLQAQTEAQP